MGSDATADLALNRICESVTKKSKFKSYLAILIAFLLKNPQINHKNFPPQILLSTAVLYLFWAIYWDAGQFQEFDISYMKALQNRYQSGSVQPYPLPILESTLALMSFRLHICLNSMTYPTLSF